MRKNKNSRNFSLEMQQKFQKTVDFLYKTVV